MATSPDPAVRQDRLEAALQDLVFRHPELLGEGWPRPRREVVISKRDRLDLLFEWPERLVVVEFKRGLLKLTTLAQIQRYMGMLRTLYRGRRVEGILIGREASRALAERMSKTRLPVKIQLAGKDLPARVVICRRCRLAYDALLEECPRDGETRHLPVR